MKRKIKIAVYVTFEKSSSFMGDEVGRSIIEAYKSITTEAKPDIEIDIPHSDILQLPKIKPLPKPDCRGNTHHVRLAGQEVGDRRHERGIREAFISSGWTIQENQIPIRR